MARLRLGVRAAKACCYLLEPRMLRTINAVLTILWVVAGIAASVFAFTHPDNPYLLALVVFVSFYANASGHLSTWASARVEIKQDEQHEELAAT